MSQNIVLINEFGIENNLVNESIYRFSDLKPLTEFKNQRNYLFPEDSSVIYFLSRADTISSSIQNCISDLFVVVDSNKIIKLIDVFFKSEPKEIEAILTKRFGKFKYLFETSISRKKINSRYTWISSSDISYILTEIVSPNGIKKFLNLTVFPSNVEEFLGEWHISAVGNGQ